MSQHNSSLVTDIDLEPTASDEGRVLALLGSRFGQQVPVYELAPVARLQYSARCHSLRHVYGYFLVNGEDGRSAERRKRTWFCLIGRLTRSQHVELEHLCREKKTHAAIVQVFPEAATYLKPQNRDKQKLIRDYPSQPRIDKFEPASTGGLFSSQELERTAKWEDQG